jgi:hypothetical protein
MRVFVVRVVKKLGGRLTVAVTDQSPATGWYCLLVRGELVPMEVLVFLSAQAADQGFGSVLQKYQVTGPGVAEDPVQVAVPDVPGRNTPSDVWQEWGNMVMDAADTALDAGSLSVAVESS